MTDIELGELIGYLLAAFAAGYGVGFLIYSFKRLTDFL